MTELEEPRPSIACPHVHCLDLGISTTMSGTENTHASSGGHDLLRRATQVMMSKYVYSAFLVVVVCFFSSPLVEPRRWNDTSKVGVGAGM